MKTSISSNIIIVFILAAATVHVANLAAIKPKDKEPKTVAITDAASKKKPQNNIQKQPESPIFWLNKICKEAAVAPQLNHSDLSIKLEILPDKNDLELTLKQFSEKTIGELEQECTRHKNDRAEFEKKRAQDLKATLENLIQSAAGAYEHAAQLQNLETLASLAYVRKLVLKPGNEIYCVGDIHGCIGSLVRNIWIWRCSGLLDDNFKVASGKYILFLGDYVDYGSNSIHVLYTLLKLKLHNWDQIVLCRGNHESALMSSRFKCLATLQKLYPEAGQKLWASCVINCFNILPFAVYIGIKGNEKFIQCCHGGLEPGYNPKAFLASTSYFESLHNAFNDYAFFDPCCVNEINNFITQYPSHYDAIFQSIDKWILTSLNTVKAIDHTMSEKEQDKEDIKRLGEKGSYQLKGYARSGFLWSDFKKDTDFWFNSLRGAGFMCNQEFINKLQQPIAAIIRGHQHNVGIKIGALEQDEDESRWFKVVKVEAHQDLPTPPKRMSLSLAAKAFKEFPFTLEFSTPHAQQAFDTNQWKHFVNHLPHFKLSDQPLKNNVPIITLTTATEAWPQPPEIYGVCNQWDSFGILTLDKEIENSRMAIYEAEAKMKEEKQAAPTSQQSLIKEKL